MLSVLFALGGASVAEQMAPARQGMLQCQMPDVLFKTCMSLSKVSQVGPGNYRFEGEILLDPNSPVVISERNTTAVQGNSVCEVIRLSAIDSWTVAIGGKPANAAQTAKYRAVMKRRFAPLAGQTVCTAIVSDEQQTHRVIVTIGGKRVPAFDYPMKWVAPDDGWTVGP